MHYVAPQGSACSSCNMRFTLVEVPSRGGGAGWEQVGCSEPHLMKVDFIQQLLYLGLQLLYAPAQPMPPFDGYTTCTIGSSERRRRSMLAGARRMLTVIRRLQRLQAVR